MGDVEVEGMCFYPDGAIPGIPEGSGKREEEQREGGGKDGGTPTYETPMNLVVNGEYLMHRKLALSWSFRKAHWSSDHLLSRSRRVSWRS